VQYYLDATRQIAIASKQAAIHSDRRVVALSAMIEQEYQQNLLNT